MIDVSECIVSVAADFTGVDLLLDAHQVQDDDPDVRTTLVDPSHLQIVNNILQVAHRPHNIILDTFKSDITGHIHREAVISIVGLIIQDRHLKGALYMVHVLLVLSQHPFEEDSRDGYSRLPKIIDRLVLEGGLLHQLKNHLEPIVLLVVGANPELHTLRKEIPLVEISRPEQLHVYPLGIPED